MFRQFETSQHARLYAQFRPEPPASLISRVIQFVSAGAPLERAVDVGCGSGQNTQHLAPYFNSVLATDISPAQIAEAMARNTQDNVEYQVSPAEDIPVPDGSVQLVAASQCYHYFDQRRFLEEADRVLAPGGVLALYFYHMPLQPHRDGQLWDELNTVMDRAFYVDTAAFRRITRQQVMDTYTRVQQDPPYADLVWDESHYQERPLSVDAMLGAISSWSGFQNMVKSCGKESGDTFLQNIRGDLLDVIAAGGDTSGIRASEDTMRYYYTLVMARKPVSAECVSEIRAA